MKDISYDFQIQTDMHRKKLSGVPVFLSLRRRPRHGSQGIHEACLITFFFYFAVQYNYFTHFLGNCPR